MLIEIGMVVFTVLCYMASILLYKKTKNPVFNPILISTILIIVILKTFNIEYDAYDSGGRYIKFFLGPSIVVLAIPLHRQFDILKKSLKPILGGIIVGILMSLITVVAIAKSVELNNEIFLSLIPKSITTPMGMLVSNQLGGIESVTIASIVLTGILGAVFAPLIVKIFRIKHPVAVGIAIGTASHAVGTSKAVEMGEIEGAMSSLSIAVTGLITVLLTPIIQIVLRLL